MATSHTLNDSSHVAQVHGPETPLTLLPRFFLPLVVSTMEDVRLLVPEPAAPSAPLLLAVGGASRWIPYLVYRQHSHDERIRFKRLQDGSYTHPINELRY